MTIITLNIVSGLQDAVSRNLLASDPEVLAARVLAINASTGILQNIAWWHRRGLEIEGPSKMSEGSPEIGRRPDADYPW